MCRVAVLLLLTGLRLQAAESASYMKIPQGARSAAMGSAFGMVPASLEAFWYNPAALGGLKGTALNFSHLNWIGDTVNEYAAVGLQTGPRSNLGISVQYAGTQDTYRDNNGRESGNFGISGMSATLGGAWDFGAIALGGSAKYLGQSVESKSGGGMVLDMGMQGRVFGGKLLISAAAQNLGTSPEAGILPPLTFRGGLGISGIPKGLILTQELQMRASQREFSYLSGLEYAPTWNNFGAALRAGYDHGATAAGGMAGLAFGGGVILKGLTLDYAFVPYGDLGSSHRASLGYAFGAATAATPAPPRYRGFEMNDGIAAFRAGRYRQAVEIFESLVLQLSDNSVAWQNLGMAYLKAGDRENAKRSLEMALKLDPSRVKIRDYMTREGL